MCEAGHLGSIFSSLTSGSTQSSLTSSSIQPVSCAGGSEGTQQGQFGFRHGSFPEWPRGQSQNHQSRAAATSANMTAAAASSPLIQPTDCIDPMARRRASAVSTSVRR